MDDLQLGGVVRLVRHRRGWRQVDLADEAGVSPSLVALLEGGKAERLSVRSVRRVTAALGIRLGWDAGYRGPELDRLRDRDHAAVAEWLARLLELHGWLVTAEVSFNHYGDRGRIDLLAYHAESGTLLVVEIKTVIANIQELLGSLNVKQRNAGRVAAGLGWHARHVVPMLVVSDTTTNRRYLAAHASLFARLSLRGRSVRSWLKNPLSTPEGLLYLVKLPNSNTVGVRRAGRQRVRAPRPHVSVESSREPATPSPELG